MPSLAPELVLQILEEAYRSQGGAHTVSQAALVCSLWRPLAQEVLFRNVDLTRTPESQKSAARAAPGILLAASGPSHAIREKPDGTSVESRASRLRALTAAATPSAPAPRSQQATLAFFNAIQINSPTPSDRAKQLSSLVRYARLYVSRFDQCHCSTRNVHIGGVCPKPCSATSPLPTGAITERELVLLLGRLPYLQNIRIILDRVTSFSPLVIDALHASSTISTLNVHVLKRWYSRGQFSVSLNNAIQSGSGVVSTASAVDESSDSAVFQLIRALGPNLDTLILEGELPRDPPADASVPVVHNRRPSLADTLDRNAEIATEPAPECSLRELVWRGKLPPSPALLAWLLSAKAQGAPALRKRSRLEVLELCHLPPPDSLAELLREHILSLQSLRLHYFEAAHVEVVRQLLGRDSPVSPASGARKHNSLSSKGKLRELVLHRQCSVAPDLLRAIQAQHVAVSQPCNQTLQVLQASSERGFKCVTIAGGNKEANERVRLACEADGVAFRNVRALTPVW
ncbi:unnamed protein product [Rhizoctonia solani]|uniref:Uncharacterized protein n=1 Tax=Rhizoctonia solani TaxID=456999 RepID=A0A8H3I683_9AGAM|nr:unnamed protein product [Rhizoctonia solani]